MAVDIPDVGASEADRGGSVVVAGLPVTDAEHPVATSAIAAASTGRTADLCITIIPVMSQINGWA
jgi:hypothetical protein